MDSVRPDHIPVGVSGILTKESGYSDCKLFRDKDERQRCKPFNGSPKEVVLSILGAVLSRGA